MFVANNKSKKAPVKSEYLTQFLLFLSWTKENENNTQQSFETGREFEQIIGVSPVSIL